jgi:calcineurin-like phosphoesterase family protein
MNNTWFCADHHIGETRLDILDRPFKSSDEMLDTFVANHNALVAKEDTVYFVGDICYQKTPELLDKVALFNGKKILFRGNHDRDISDGKFLRYFDQVIPEGLGVETEVEGIKCFITHYPTCARADRFNLVGHIHGVWKVQLNMLNVGLDVHSFRPINSKKVAFYHKAIHDFYDEDAWVCYNEINEAFKGKRGKKGTYFTPKGL